MFRAKLADFGFSVELPNISHGQTLFSSDFIVRSEGYYPSEITLGKYSDRSDVYSFGVVSSLRDVIAFLILAVILCRFCWKYIQD